MLNSQDLFLYFLKYIYTAKDQRTEGEAQLSDCTFEVPRHGRSQTEAITERIWATNYMFAFQMLCIYTIRAIMGMFPPITKNTNQILKEYSRDILLGIHPDRTACGNPISGYSIGECWNPAAWHSGYGPANITTSSRSVKARFDFLCPTIALSAESPFLRRWGRCNSCWDCWRESGGRSQKNKLIYSNMQVWYRPFLYIHRVGSSNASLKSSAVLPQSFNTKILFPLQ